MKNPYLIFENKGFRELNPLYMGNSIFAKGETVTPCKKDTYFFHFIFNGAGDFECDKITYKVKAGDLFITLPNQKVVHKADKENPFHTIWIEFSGEFGKKLFDLPSQLLEYPENTFYELKKVFSLNSQKVEFVTGKLFEVFAYIFQENKEPSNHHLKIKNYIDINYMDINISVKQIADIIGLNKRYMTRIFKEETGLTIIEYIIEKRMSEAARLLKNKKLMINEIAFLTGYSDPYYFSKTFKQKYNMSPSTFRSTLK